MLLSYILFYFYLRLGITETSLRSEFLHLAYQFFLSIFFQFSLLFPLLLALFPFQPFLCLLLYFGLQVLRQPFFLLLIIDQSIFIKSVSQGGTEVSPGQDPNTALSQEAV